MPSTESSITSKLEQQKFGGLSVNYSKIIEYSVTKRVLKRVFGFWQLPLCFSQLNMIGCILHFSRFIWIFCFFELFIKLQMETQSLGSVEKKKKLHIISTVNILELHRSLVELEIQVKNTPFFTVVFLM